MQEQRELKNQSKNVRSENPSVVTLDAPQIENDTDIITTNIFVGNLHKSTTEQDLVDVFGRYGALASVKIMVPRPEENKPFIKNCGFVAYMNRPDCDRAMNRLRGKELHGNELKLGWGKPVALPPFPIHVPETLFELLRPPRASGLPFNAQPRDWIENDYKDLIERVKLVQNGTCSSLKPPCLRDPFDIREMSRSEINDMLTNCVVKVTTPTDRAILILIHRTIEFVVLEGPEFEAAIIHKEQGNPVYRFLYDFNSPEHIYYRWKLWSLLHAETSHSWCCDDFKMFLSGPWWRPPPISFFSNPMPEELIIADNLSFSPNFNNSDPLYTIYDAERDRLAAINQANTLLTDSRRKKLTKLLKNIEPTVNGIGKVMLWCLQHAESAEDIVLLILKSLDPNGLEDEKLVSMPILVSRIYLISDILYNSCAKAPNASAFRRVLERHLPAMFTFLNKHYCILLDETQTIKLKGEQLKQKVLLCLRAWHDWAIYSNDFLHILRDSFLGVSKKSEDEIRVEETSVDEPVEKRPKSAGLVQYDDDDEDPDVDGKPLENTITKNNRDSDDSDGVPLDISKPIGVKMGFNPLAPEPISDNNKSSAASSLFIKSKWETLDEETVESEKSGRWKLFNSQNSPKDHPKSDIDGQQLNSSEFNLVAYDDDDISSGNDDLDGKPLESLANFQVHKKDPKVDRDKLREIEVRVLKYQDELETSCRRNNSANKNSIDEQVKKYRDRLIESAIEKMNSSKSSSGNSIKNGSYRKRDKTSNDDSSSDDSRKKLHRSSRSLGDKSRSPSRSRINLHSKRSSKR